ncbi:hypothetical protein ACFLTP_08565 [Chloroflexota bacterium]
MYDVIVVGGGHKDLFMAAYLAKAALNVSFSIIPIRVTAYNFVPARKTT